MFPSKGYPSTLNQYRCDGFQSFIDTKLIQVKLKKNNVIQVKKEILIGRFINNRATEIGLQNEMHVIKIKKK